METATMKPAKPKRMCVLVTENGNLITNVRMPYFMFKMGMKFGKRPRKTATSPTARMR